MKKSIRLLSVLLAMVLCFTCMSMGVSAAYADYSEPAGFEHDQAYISLYQCGSIIADKIDAMLAAKEDDLKGHVKVIDIDYDLTSIDKAHQTVHDLLESGVWKNGSNLVNLGDLENINFNAIESMPLRTATGRTDVEVLTYLLKFLYDNWEIIGRVIDGKFNNGSLKTLSFGKLDINAMVGSVHQKIKTAAYNALFKNGKSSCKPTSTLDAMVNEYLYNFLIDSGKYDTYIGSLEKELVEGGFMTGYGVANFDLNNIKVYDLIRCVLRAVLNDFVKPKLKSVLKGNTDILPLVTQLLGMEIPENDPATGKPFTDTAYVNYIVDDLMDLQNGALSKFIRVTDSGISLTEDFESLVNNLVQTAQGLMGTLKSFDTVDTWTEEEIAAKLTKKPQTMAYLVRTVLTSMIDYMVIPKTMPVRDPDTGVVTEEPVNGYAVATYALINVMADKMPERNYMQMIENYKTNTGTPDQQLNPGQEPVLTKNDAGTVIEYVEPAAFTILADYMYYFLNGKTTMNIPAGLSFDETLQFIVNWVLHKFGGLVRTDNLNMTATPTLENMIVWKNIDILLWENVFNITWLQKDYVSSFKDTNGNYTGNVTRTILLDNLLYTIVDLDFSKLNNLLSIFNKYEGPIAGYPATGELDLNVIPFVLTLVKRLLNGLFQSGTALFAKTIQQGNTVIQNNANVNVLEDIISAQSTVDVPYTTSGKTETETKTNLRIIAENLSVLLSTKDTDPNDGQQKTYADMILASALPLVAESMGKPKEGDGTTNYLHYDLYPTHGETCTLQELMRIVENQQPSRKPEANMLTDEDYFFFGSEDFNPLYKFYNYRKVYREAKAIKDTYDKETENIEQEKMTEGENPHQWTEADRSTNNITQEELNILGYRLGVYYDRLTLREADVTQLKQEIDNAVDKFGAGAYETAEAGNVFQANQFTKKTWDEYNDALQFAQGIYREYLYNGSGSIRQSKISAARELLIIAEKALKFFGSLAEYAELDKQIALAAARLNASAADPDLYYPNTVADLLLAYNAALNVNRGYDGSDQNIIDDAATALEDAILGLAHPPQIAKVSGKKTVLDKPSHRLWGVAEKQSDYNSYIQALGNGVIRYTPTANGTGTGTEAYLSLEGEKLQYYYVIIFGDIDGDARADATDCNLLMAYMNDRTSLSENALFASDADNDGEVNSYDAYVLRQSGLMKYTVDQRGVA